jgi:hypothetical protein
MEEFWLRAIPSRQQQYPISRQAQSGIQKHLDQFLKYGMLKACQSPWNTPFLPVKKPGTDDYQPVQVLRIVNQATVNHHSVVPNPYTFLSLIPADTTVFTCLDLKDAFFCIRLAPQSQQLLPSNGVIQKMEEDNSNTSATQAPLGDWLQGIQEKSPNLPV